MFSIIQLMAMSNKELTETIASVDASRIEGRGLRRKFVSMRRKQGGFTLLELLVVVAILATLAGAVLVAYDGQEAKAALGQSVNTLAATDRAVRTFSVLEKTAPNALDSLVAYPYGAGTAAAPVPATGTLLGNFDELATKVAATKLTADQTTALINAGITSLRYVDEGANDNTTGGQSTGTVNGATFPDGPLNQADIPNRVFDDPLAGKNRGRGFAVNVDATAPNQPVAAVWNAGANGVNNIKLGAAATDVLVVFGLGNNASIIGSANGISEAPFYTNVGKSNYGRFLLVYNLGPSTAPFEKAKLQTVLDTHGDFRDEEFAEFTGQKK